jgi:hypothetical protein
MEMENHNRGSGFKLDLRCLNCSNCYQFPFEECQPGETVARDGEGKWRHQHFADERRGVREEKSANPNSITKIPTFASFQFQ